VAALASVKLSPTSVIGGASATATVALTAPAPAGGIVVALKSNNFNIASVPASVLVQAGATSQTFTVTTSAVKRRATVTISATYAGITKSATLTVNRR
jgi:hypothetical protein